MTLFAGGLAAAAVVTLAIARVLAWFAASAALWIGGDKNVWRNWCAETGEIESGLAGMRAIVARIPAGRVRRAG